MAIDTREKRNSALVDPWGVLPFPDDAIDSGDRLTLVGQYSGIAVPVPPVSPSSTAEREFRVYGRDGRRIHFPQDWITSVEFELVERGGFSQGTVRAFATWEEMQEAGFQGGERFDIYLFGVLVYRGAVRVPEKTLSSSGQEAQLTLYGPMEQTNLYQVDCAYAYGPGETGEGVDLSRVFTDMALDHVLQADRLPALVLDVQDIGIRIQSFDPSAKNFTQAANALCDRAPNQCVWGFDVDPSGLTRLYFRPKPTAIARKYSVTGAGVSFRYPLDLTSIVNAARALTGGKVEQPNLCPNPSFEKIAPPGEDAGNLLIDASFEDGSPYWHFSSGATWEPDGGDGNGGPRTGSHWAELDTAGEEVDQTVPVWPGARWRLKSWERLELAVNTNAFTMEIEGLDSGGSTVDSVSVTYDSVSTPSLAGETYEPFICPNPLAGPGCVDWRAHPTIVKARVTIRAGGGSASDDGVLVDDVSFCDADQPGQESWKVAAFGTAHIASLEWASRGIPGVLSPRHGKYCLRLGVTNVFTPADDLVEIHLPKDAIKVDTRDHYAMGIWYSTGGLGLPAGAQISFGVAQIKSDGTLGTTIQRTISAGALVDDARWHMLLLGPPDAGIQDGINTDASTVSLQPFIRVRGNYGAAVATLFFDAVWLGRGDLPAALGADAAVWDGSQDYWPADTYERYSDVEDAELTGLSAAAAASIRRYGRQEAAISFDSVVDRATSTALLTDYFNAHATPKIAGQLDVWPNGANELLDLSGKVQFLDLPDAPDALSASRVHYTIAEHVSLSGDVGNERPDMADLLTQTEERAKRGL